MLPILQSLLGLLIPLAQLHLHHDELHVRVRHARVGRLGRADALDHAVVARLLLELAHGRLLGRLLGVDEPRRPLDRVGVQGRAVLDDEQGGGGPGRVQKNVAHGHGVHAGLAPRLALRDLPGSRLADLVHVVDLLEGHPPGLLKWEVGDLSDDGFLGLVRHDERTISTFLVSLLSEYGQRSSSIQVTYQTSNIGLEGSNAAAHDQQGIA